MGTHTGLLMLALGTQVFMLLIKCSSLTSPQPLRQIPIRVSSVSLGLKALPQDAQGTFEAG